MISTASSLVPYPNIKTNCISLTHPHVLSSTFSLLHLHLLIFILFHLLFFILSSSSCSILFHLLFFIFSSCSIIYSSSCSIFSSSSSYFFHLIPEHMVHLLFVVSSLHKLTFVTHISLLIFRLLNLTSILSLFPTFMIGLSGEKSKTTQI